MLKPANSKIAVGGLASQVVPAAIDSLSLSNGERMLCHTLLSRTGGAMPTMKGKRVLTSLYLDPPTHADLKQLSATTRVPIAVYLREAISDLLTKYRAEARSRSKP